MSHIAPSLAQEDKSKSTTWRYAVAGARDLRIDFMRGIALVMMVVAHTEVMSVFNIFSWERFGLTTGAEGFVILSGFMLGMLNRARLQKWYYLRCHGALSPGVENISRKYHYHSVIYSSGMGSQYYSFRGYPFYRSLFG